MSLEWGNFTAFKTKCISFVPKLFPTLRHSSNANGYTYIKQHWECADESKMTGDNIYFVNELLTCTEFHRNSATLVNLKKISIKFQSACSSMKALLLSTFPCPANPHTVLSCSWPTRWYRSTCLMRWSNEEFVQWNEYRHRLGTGIERSRNWEIFYWRHSWIHGRKVSRYCWSASRW